MNKALLDTDILSEIGKAKDATVAANAKTYRRSFGHYTLSTVSVMEVVSGFQRTQATGRLNAFLATLPHMEVLPFDQPAAELAGRIAGDLERIGQPIGVADTMIAAIAIENGLELVTATRRIISVSSSSAIRSCSPTGGTDMAPGESPLLTLVLRRWFPEVLRHPGTSRVLRHPGTSRGSQTPRNYAEIERHPMVARRFSRTQDLRGRLSEPNTLRFACE